MRSDCPLKGLYLDLAANALGSLAPLEFNGVQIMLACDILRGPKPGVFDIHLNKHLPKAIVEFLVNVNPAIYFGRFNNLTLGITFQARINSTDIFTADARDPGDRSTDGKMFPVYSGYLGRSKCTCKDWQAHPDFFVPAILGLGIHG